MLLVGLTLLLGLAATPVPSSEAVALKLQPQTNAQQVALSSTEPELCYSGRRFGGKSWIGCAKALLYAAKYPGARVALSREERASMEGTTLLTLRAEIVPAVLWADWWKESKSTLYLPNGSEIMAFGLDRPGRALGARYGLAVVDQAEQLDYNQFQIINSCVMQVGMPFHQSMLLFNPDSPDHWAFRRYKPDDGDGLRRDESGRTFARVVHVMPDDLMEFLSENSRARLDNMDGVWRLRYRLGMWAAFEGSVYGDLWLPGLHMVDRPLEWERWGGYPPPTWARYRAIDFGLQNPFVCQWWAQSPDGIFYRYREVYHTGRITEDHARQINQCEADELAELRKRGESDYTLAPYLDGLNVTFGVSDPARPDLRETLYRAGIGTQPADNDVLAGIEAVRAMLKNGPAGPRIRFVKGALVETDASLVQSKLPTCTEEEVGGYRWQKNRATGSEAGPRDLPIKENDHGLDAMRYLFKTMTSRPRPMVYA